MDDFSAVTAFLLWVAPVLVPILAVGILVVVLPLAVGVVVAIAVALVRAARGLPSRDLTPQDDPWSRLTALTEPAEDAGGREQPGL